MQLPALRAGRLRELILPYLAALGAALLALAGLVGIVEMAYRLSEQGENTVLSVLGLSFDARSAPPWMAFCAVLAAGLLALGFASRLVGARWNALQHDLLSKRP
jgi:branched-chain amino acid transport system permease protein